MNYANMIQEEKLKKGFIIATLLSTVIGTFTASMTLHDKVQEKRQTAKQKKLDDGQDEQIQQLREEVKKLKSSEDDDDRSRSRSRDRRRRRRRDDYYEEEEEDFARSAQRSRRMIQQEYDANLARVGQRYAEGDVITENKLQAQIITLQQTVINVLQDCLESGRSLTKADVHRLISAQETARNGSLEALRGQYERLLPVEPQRLRLEDTQRHHALPPPPPDLFCHYSQTLQKTRQPLHPTFTPKGPQRCPACSMHIPVTTQDVWALEVRTPNDADNVIEVREFELDARLIVKSHTPRGDFACVLCAREREMDCVCRSLEGLVEHLGRVHTVEEFRREGDMYQL